MSTSLLQDVLRPSVADQLSTQLKSVSLRHSPPRTDKDDSEDELVDVQSLPGTPSRSRPSTRPSSPTRSGASRRPAPGPLLLSKRSSTSDPLRVFPSAVSQRIFGQLNIGDLASCSRVSKKWSQSQSLNYIWFQQYRKDNFHDETLPAGKWTRRESKQNWRQTFLKTSKQRDKDLATTSYTYSRSSTPLGSGYQTPREIREEQWRTEGEVVAKPGKLEMREIYKDLGGRKARSKNKVGAGDRDKGGWADMNDDGW